VTNIKKKSSHQEQSSRRSTASRAECFLVGVGDLADGELARWLLRRLSGGVDGQAVRRPRWTELPRRFEPSRRSEPPSHYESFWIATSFWTGRFGVLTRQRRSGARRRLSKPGQSSSCPDDRRRCPVCHSASSRQ